MTAHDDGSARQCRYCVHFSAPGNKLGYCRKVAPQVADDETKRWPQVWAWEGCGDFDPRPETTTEDEDG